MPAPQFKSPTAAFSQPTSQGPSPPYADQPADNVEIVDVNSLEDMPPEELAVNRVPLKEQVGGEEPAAPAASGATLETRQCPRCMLDLTQAYVYKPTAEELQDYALSLLPGTVRYTKTYTLPSKMTISFRVLSPAEVTAIGWQAELDRGVEIPNAMWLYNIDLYRLVWQTYKITAPASGTVMEIPPTLNAAAKSTRTETLLPQTVDWFKQNIFANESLLRVVMGCLFDFNMRVANMEALARDPDFYNGIAASV